MNISVPTRSVSITQLSNSINASIGITLQSTFWLSWQGRVRYRIG